MEVYSSLLVLVLHSITYLQVNSFIDALLKQQVVCLLQHFSWSAHQSHFQSQFFPRLPLFVDLESQVGNGELSLETKPRALIF